MGFSSWLSGTPSYLKSLPRAERNPACTARGGAGDRGPVRAVQAGERAWVAGAGLGLSGGGGGACRMLGVEWAATTSHTVLQVQSVLEQSSPWKEHRAVSLPQELLGSSWDSKAPAWVLLEECGLELQVDVPQVHWQPDAQGRTSALYACLVLLPHLSQDSA